MIADMSTSEIAALLRQDGYRALAGRASEIREAARHGRSKLAGCWVCGRSDSRISPR